MDKIVLICATGRSGSTTMQRIINTIPNSNICGENFGAVNSLLAFYRRLKHASDNFIPGRFNPKSYEELVDINFKPSWYNSFNFDEVVNNIKLLITNLFKNSQSTNVWGFKEIRYDGENIKYMKEFKELFPQTKVIIQIRQNILAQSKSSWHKNNKKAIVDLYKQNNNLLNFYNKNKSYCYFSTFEKMFDKNNIKNIFNFIECDEHYNEKKVDEILKNNLPD
jgi:hypothetical protein